MRERTVGALAGVLAAALMYGLAQATAGRVVGALCLALVGWGLGGYIRHLQRLAERDELTGLSNRRPFERAMAREWERALRDGRHLSLLFLDVDDFGMINKRYGHLMGDEVLKLVCRQIRQNVRRSDLVARWGGEEFVILLPDTSMVDACLIAERIRSVVEQCVIHDRDRSVAVTVSTGVASYPGTASSALDLLRQAIDGQGLAKVQKNSVEIVS